MSCTMYIYTCYLAFVNLQTILYMSATLYNTLQTIQTGEFNGKNLSIYCSRQLAVDNKIVSSLQERKECTQFSHLDDDY